MPSNELRESTVTKSTKFLPVLLAMIALQPYVHAAEPAAYSMVATTPVDEEEQLDDGLKRFGYLAGLARGCVVETQRVDLEREALDLHAGIARLLGIDRAFLFSSAFGYGTTVATEIKDCAEVLKNYEQRVAEFRAGRGEKK
jgi:hypothetical protein